MQTDPPMRVAWFAPAPGSAALRGVLPDHLSAVAAELARSHVVEHVDADAAHQFVWKAARTRYDLCVYELADTPRHQFIWPYLLRYPGVVVLRSATLLGARAAALRRSHRLADYDAERRFAGVDLLRIPVLAARMVVVFDEAMAEAVRDRFPDATVRVVPVGVAAVSNVEGEVAREIAASLEEDGRERATTTRFGVLDPCGRPLAERAMRRARDAGSRAELIAATAPDQVLRDADVVLALTWPPAAEPPAAALAGMACGKPVVAFETGVTAAWPALDPQTWQPRGYDASADPIAVSIDPRDDEHSLMLTIRRLAADPALRTVLAAAAHDWWGQHATIGQAVAAWQDVLRAAVALDPPPRPIGWPPHLDADGSEHARRTLDELGVTVDFL